MFGRVPERSSSDSIVDQSEEWFLDQQLSVKHHQLGGGGDQIIASMKLEELDKHLPLILLYSINLMN